MTSLFIINDPPYGTERAFNALRLATNLQQRQEQDVAVFLMGDAASAAKAGQSTPDGYYKLDRMLAGIIRRGGRVLVCGTCMDARGLTDQELLEGATRSSMDELSDETMAARQTLVF
jgi:uncharacterized protein involved in oxidation of intracellular sulfur